MKKSLIAFWRHFVAIVVVLVIIGVIIGLQYTSFNNYVNSLIIGAVAFVGGILIAYIASHIRENHYSAEEVEEIVEGEKN